MNSFGKKLVLTTFGESHGKAMGGIIDGFPSCFKIDFENLQQELNKRRPGGSELVSARDEKDIPEFLSGINEDGITLGTPIGFLIRNNEFRKDDYKHIERAFRPNHADYTYLKKYGITDSAGGGRASGRETVNWVVAGALAYQWLKTQGIAIQSFLTQAGNKEDYEFFDKVSKGDILGLINSDTRAEVQKTLEREIAEAKKKGESIGGKVSCIITGVKPGVGEPTADKLSARLSQAMMSINAAKGFEYGLGFKSASAYGSKTLDRFIPYSEKTGDNPAFTNFSGGIQGGISNGMPIYFTVAFKPTPTLLQPVETIDREGNKYILQPKGRHDPCVALRAVPVVKAMASLVIADFLL